MHDLPANAPPSRLMTVNEVADYLRLSDRQLRRLIAAGDLPVHRLGRAIRISEADLNEFLDRNRN
jgi:excisionase family DNA binding protein